MFSMILYISSLYQRNILYIKSSDSYIYALGLHVCQISFNNKTSFVTVCLSGILIVTQEAFIDSCNLTYLPLINPNPHHLRQ